MKKIFKRKFKRNDDKDLLLYGFKKHKEKSGVELERTKRPEPHLRWNPAREEWVTYSSERKNRTFFSVEKVLLY